jgi:Glycoside hydrolase 123, catalytic domain
MTRTSTVFLLTLILALSASLATAGQSSSAPAGTKQVLNEYSFYRYHVMVRRPEISVAAFKAAGKPADAPKVIPVKVPYRSYPGIDSINSAAPPKHWAQPDFDDSEWGRAPVSTRHRAGTLSIDRIPYTPGVRFAAFRVSVRGKFKVTDPAAVQSLYVSFKYRGGTVVYLNGREVFRAHLPGGALKDGTPAELYPNDVWVTSKGKPIPGERNLRLSKKLSAAEKTAIKARAAKRGRSVVAVKIPTKALRKGVNVLAVEVRRSDYHPAALSRKWGQWIPIAFSGFKLHAAGTGVQANVARPGGVQIWKHDINARVTIEDYADPHEKLGKLKLYGARNGTFSGMIVLGSGAAISSFKVTAADLASKNGKGKIEAKNVSFRYGVAMKGRHNPDWFDGTTARAPNSIPLRKGGGAVLPVLISVRVPKNAKPGVYAGKVKVSAGGKTVDVPLEVNVAAWTIPAPEDYRCYIGIYQSPTSLAMQYKVEMWSEKHWKLMEKSYALLGQVGNKLINVPIVDQTQFGNDESFVTYIKKPGPSTGSGQAAYEYDFKLFDKLMDLVAKHWTKPEFVALQAWHSAGWAARKADQKNTITVLDKKTGKKERVQLPKFDSAEARKFWKPLLAAIHKRLKQRGWSDTMCVGILSDGTAPNSVFAMFDAAWPGGGPARWTRGCHVHTNAPKPYRASKGGGLMVLHEHCYGMGMADPAKGLPPLHKLRIRPAAAYIRHNFDHSLSLLKYRNMPERGLYCGKRGIGRICLDFWAVRKGNQYTSNIYNRYPHSSCAQRAPSLYALGHPGPDGAEPTFRFENFRLGVQDAEALIFLSEAASEQAAKIGPKLVARYKQLLIARMSHCKLLAPEYYGRVHHRVNHHGWQAHNRELYKLAGEVAGKLGTK